MVTKRKLPLLLLQTGHTTYDQICALAAVGAGGRGVDGGRTGALGAAGAQKK